MNKQARRDRLNSLTRALIQTSFTAPRAWKLGDAVNERTTKMASFFYSMNVNAEVAFQWTI